eukprot:Gb_14458 [translate_table: standard]
MAMALWNDKKKQVIMFFQPIILHCIPSIPSFTSFTTSNTQTKGRQQLHGTGNNISHGDLKTRCEQSRMNEALHILHFMECPDFNVYDSLLQWCVSMKALPEGKLVHAHMIQTGFKPDNFLETKLIIMYAKCECLPDGRRVLQAMDAGNVVSWTAMIASYARHGSGEEALTLFYQMQCAGIRPDQFAFASVLPACAKLAALEDGKEIHKDIIRSGFQSDIFVGNGLVDMYAKCRSLKNARDVFDKMPRQDVVSWSAMISGYAQNGYYDEALKLFRQMQMLGVKPNSVTYSSLLSACANLTALQQGKETHDDIIRSGFQSDAFVANALVDMYAKCGSTECARHVFDKMATRDVISWNAMIAGYAQNGHVDEALKLFQEMPKRNVVSSNVMIAGYVQNGLVDKALKLFEEMPERNIVSWNSMISGYAQTGHIDEALKLFQQMQQTGVKPNSVTFASVLPACADLGTLEHGKEFHEAIIRSGFQSDIFVANALVDMYNKCGSIENARLVFDKMPARDTISWNGIIVGYAQNGDVDEALNLFQKMPERNVVSWNVMIAGYAQHTRVDEALKLFKNMPERNVVSLNAMIAGYVQNGLFDDALNLFRQMQLTSLKPNSITFASVLTACANLAALQEGKEVHEDIVRSGFQPDILVCNALTHMYAKCGSIEEAHKAFDGMPKRNVVSWNAMIVGYAIHGSGTQALRLFEQMKHSGTKPNRVTFVGVLSACCHAGLVDDGWRHFDCMSRVYDITPSVEHYSCMVDLLGRAGFLDEALDFINKMPIKPDAAVWGSLLAACRIHTNIELGERVAERLFDLDPENPAHYVVLSNIYAVVGRWDDKEKVRKMMKDRRVRKSPGCSWIEVNNKVYAFIAGGRSYPQTQTLCQVGDVVWPDEGGMLCLSHELYAASY